jgi:hypothetical protein
MSQVVGLWGRKNYLFAGSDAPGERAVAIYTLLGAAKLNGFNPQAYLRYVLERIADHRIDELLPWRCRDARSVDHGIPADEINQ